MTKTLARRNVGQTECDVSVLGLGGAPLGNLFEVLPEATALDTVQVAYDAGVGYFDMAPQYGHGVAEHRMGHVLRHKDRSSFTLSTKVGRLLKPASGNDIRRGNWKSTQDVDLMVRDIPADLWTELRAEGLLNAAAPVPDGPFA